MQNIVYAKLQPGVMKRQNGRKVIITPDNQVQDPILPKWSDESTLCKASTLSELKTTNCPVAIHCGLSELLVLDFDDDAFDEALALNNSLNANLQCTNIFKSAEKDGGHFIYKFSNNKLTAFINNPNGCKLNKLDTLYGNCLVYAATPANKTKLVLKESDKLIEIPLAMQLLAISKYQEKKYKAMVSKEHTVANGSKLGIIAELALSDENYFKQLLGIITPVRFKEIMAMSSKNIWTLHPDRIPEGEGYNYILAISGVLMLDPSINKDLHFKLLVKINECFTTPLLHSRIDNIYNRDIASKEYKYNPKWKDETFCVISRHSHLLEVYGYYSNNSISYIVLDATTFEVKTFRTTSALLDYLLIVSGKKLNRDTLLKNLTEIEVIHRPDEPFGKVGNRFNAYRQCKEQEVFYNPSKYKEEWTPTELNMKYDASHPRWPRVTLAAMRNSCGDRLAMFLSFMARKYRTREHSPLFFVFYGVPHSFKSAIVNGVFCKLSKDRYANISVDMLNDKFNAWQVNKDLVLLDEVQYITARDISSVIKNINAISGSSTINGIRRMFEDVDTKSYKQELTFILATNEVLRLTNEVNERRMVVFNSKTRVSDALDMSNQEIAECIKSESVDFAYYLSTQVPSLDDTAYLHNEAWKTKTYHTFIEQGQSMEDKVAKAIDSDDLKSLLAYYMDMGGSKELFKRAVSINGHGKYIIRLKNTRADLASVDAIFDRIDDFNFKALSKKLDLMEGKINKINDVQNGSTSGNKAIIYYADRAVQKVIVSLNLGLPTIDEIFKHI